MPVSRPSKSTIDYFSINILLILKFLFSNSYKNEMVEAFQEQMDGWRLKPLSHKTLQRPQDVIQATFQKCHHMAYPIDRFCPLLVLALTKCSSHQVLVVVFLVLLENLWEDPRLVLNKSKQSKERLLHRQAC